MEETMRKNHFFLFFLMILLLSAFGFSETNPKWATGITINPPAPHDGEVVRFAATLEVKLGPVSNLRIIGGVDGSRIYDETFTNLPQGYTKEVGFKWIATAAAPRTAYFQLDPDGTSGDVTPGDNRVSRTFDVSPIADLVAEVSYQPTPNGWTCEEVCCLGRQTGSHRGNGRDQQRI